MRGGRDAPRIVTSLTIAPCNSGAFVSHDGLASQLAPHRTIIGVMGLLACKPASPSVVYDLGIDHIILVHNTGRPRHIEGDFYVPTMLVLHTWIVEA